MSVLQLLYSCLLLAFSYGGDNSQMISYKEIRGKVIRIKDGDTIDILFDGKALTIRFAHVDCPEKKQPFGNKAKQFTADKCFGQIVTVRHENKYDRNRRLIAVVFNELGENINKELLSAGLAWHFKKYSTDSSYSNLEMIARAQKVGLWEDPNPIPPWNWRGHHASKNLGIPEVRVSSPEK